MNRRSFLLASSALAWGAALDRRTIRAGQTETLAFSYPIGVPGRTLGDGFLILHGFATENTWYLPGYYHAGEDWYAIEGDTAGAGVYAIAAGEVVFAGSEYPGRVVLVRHADDLYSMYGHLDYSLEVGEGDAVDARQLLGTVLRRADGRAPSHLHFEVRTFLTTPEVNGAAPRYGFACGPNCPPGPGYWPIDAPDHPSDLGWRNPTHVIAGDGADLPAEVVVAAQPSAAETPILSALPDDDGSRRLGELTLEPGDRFPLLDVHAGPADSRDTSAETYELWYRLRLPDGRRGWVQAAVPSTADTGSDGRPSSVRFDLLPAVTAS